VYGDPEKDRFNSEVGVVAGLVSEFNRPSDWAIHTVRSRLEDEKIYDFDRAPMERLFAPFNTCTTLMFVYRVIDLYQENKYDDPSPTSHLLMIKNYS